MASPKLPGRQVLRILASEIVESMRAITAQTRGEAWLMAARHLASRAKWEDYNLVLQIDCPSLGNGSSRQIQLAVNNLVTRGGGLPIHTVAETIFPATEYKQHGVPGVYKIYPDEIYPLIKRDPRNNWGTYAYRLVRRETSNHKILNPLEGVIDKLSRQLKTGNPKRAAYELGLTDDGNDLTLYDPKKDAARIMGGQCLSHISLKLGPTEELYLTALYRSHYYMGRVLGNLLGLARLQAFIAREIGIPVGPLVCHSTFAKLETSSGGWTKHDVENLLASLTDNEGTSPAH